MEDEKLYEILEAFVERCKEKNYRGFALVKIDDNTPIKCGIASDYPSTANLLNNFFSYLQQDTGCSSINLAIQLALLSALDEIDPDNSYTNWKEVSVEALAKAFEMVNQNLKAQLVDIVAERNSKE